MSIQSSINSMISSVGSGVFMTKHLLNQNKPNQPTAPKAENANKTANSVSSNTQTIADNITNNYLQNSPQFRASQNAIMRVNNDIEIKKFQQQQMQSLINKQISEVKNGKS